MKAFKRWSTVCHWPFEPKVLKLKIKYFCCKSVVCLCVRVCVCRHVKNPREIMACRKVLPWQSRRMKSLFFHRTGSLQSKALQASLCSPASMLYPSREGTVLSRQRVVWPRCLFNPWSLCQSTVILFLWHRHLSMKKWFEASSFHIEHPVAIRW